MFTCCYCFVARYPQNLTISNTLNPSYTLTINSNAEFTCLATANDVSNLEYFFVKVGGSLATNVRRPAHDGNTIDRRTTMHINGVRTENAGDYQCIVRNFSRDSLVLDRVNFTITVSG